MFYLSTKLFYLKYCLFFKLYGKLKKWESEKIFQAFSFLIFLYFKKHYD
jgi:hypothetical protein